MVKAFGQWDPKWFYSTFSNHSKFYLLLAFIENTPVAFKLGYDLNKNEFYSWLGGVIPEYRGLGIAADLMKKQHEWCQMNGYSKVQTKTQNRFREMLLLNIRFGFDIIGYHMSNEGGPKIILEKYF
ncbi:MAG: GNAT family N-acetyltransferase [Bdellovibrionaceae bacterium]|nr:GNAT family N-acetyltransferase [Pseudobdellovibrionaceae bacterium]